MDLFATFYGAKKREEEEEEEAETKPLNANVLKRIIGLTLYDQFHLLFHDDDHGYLVKHVRLRTLRWSFHIEKKKNQQPKKKQKNKHTHIDTKKNKAKKS